MEGFRDSLRCGGPSLLPRTRRRIPRPRSPWQNRSETGRLFQSREALDCLIAPLPPEDTGVPSHTSLIDP